MKTIKEIVEQLGKCNYSDDLHHPLRNNIAFIRLQELADLNYQPEFGLNEKVIYKEKEMYVHAIRCVPSSHPEPEVEYLLSDSYNRQSTTNEGISGWVHEVCVFSARENMSRKIDEAKKLLQENGFDVERRNSISHE